MIDLDKLLSTVGQLVALGMAISVIFSRFHELQRDIVRLRHHLKSHCQMLDHVGEHLQAKTGYQPIDKAQLD